MLIVQVAGAPAPPRRRIGRAKPKDSDPGATPTVPVTTITAVRPDDLGSEESAQRWLTELRGDDDALAAEIDQAVALINRAVHAHRAATLDAQIADVGPGAALAVRVGFGEGDDLAEGRFGAAVDVPLAERRRRAELLRPQERVADVLGGRAEVPICELLVIRARADLDAGRLREAALQVRVGLEALLAQRDALAARDQDEDFASLEERRAITGEAANEALAGELADARSAEVTETLRICERVLRRKRALG